MLESHVLKGQKLIHGVSLVFFSNDKSAVLYITSTPCILIMGLYCALFINSFFIYH